MMFLWPWHSNLHIMSTVDIVTTTTFSTLARCTCIVRTYVSCMQFLLFLSTVTVFHPQEPKFICLHRLWWICQPYCWENWEATLGCCCCNCTPIHWQVCVYKEKLITCKIMLAIICLFEWKSTPFQDFSPAFCVHFLPQTPKICHSRLLVACTVKFG